MSYERQRNVKDGDEVVPRDDKESRSATKGPLIHGVGHDGLALPAPMTHRGQSVQDSEQLCVQKQILAAIENLSFQQLQRDAFQIEDGCGTERKLCVTSNNAIRVSPITIAAGDLTPEELIQRRYFNDFLREPGLTFEMNADGSATPVEFEVVPTPGFVTFITSIRFIFHDTFMDMGGGEAGRFASVTRGALTNGIKLTVDQGGNLTEVFSEDVVVMADFLQYNDDFINITGAFGAGVDYLSFDFAFPESVPLTVSATDRVYVTLQDDLTDLNFFRCVAIGIKEAI